MFDVTLAHSEPLHRPSRPNGSHTIYVNEKETYVLNIVNVGSVVKIVGHVIYINAMKNVSADSNPRPVDSHTPLSSHQCLRRKSRPHVVRPLVVEY